MKVNEVISKLRVMLGSETETVEEIQATETKLEEEIKEETEVKMADATLVDGTEVYTEGDLAAGSILYVKVEEGDAPFAPEGLHETNEGLLITVGENGEIVSIEEKSQDAPAEETLETEEVVEETMEEEKEEETMEEEEKKEKEFDADQLIGAIAEMLKPQSEVIEELKEKLATLEARFNEVADQPAAKPVKNTFSQEAANKKDLAQRRLDHIIALKKK